MKIKYANKIYDVLYTMKVLGKLIYAVEDEPNHIDWLVNVEVIDEQKSMKVYRVENEAEQKGLWRKFDGTYEPLFDMLTDGQCRDLPMEDNPIYREGGKRWFASAPSKETLQKWFSKRDLEELVAKGFTISAFEVVGYKKVSDFEYIFTRDNIINRTYLEVSDIYPEQKVFVSKVEPKFKVGDFIVNDYCRGKVVELTNDAYLLDTGQGIPFSYEHNIHLWTIEDAKDGDILWHSDSASNGIFIFKEIRNDGKVLCYCDYDSEDHFCFGEHHTCCWTSSKYVKPATKEQRDLLFTKMYEAGYEWNEEKKELKNLEKQNEQKFIWDKFDDLMLKDLIEFIESGWSGNGKSHLIYWLKSIKDRIK